ncbi:MAG: NADH-quinone oxidoreductase subunit C [Acidobacteriota bacterium]
MPFSLSTLSPELNVTAAEIAATPAPNEIYLRVSKTQIPEVCLQLYRQMGFRFCGMFAADLRATEGNFRLYYVFSEPQIDSFVLLSADVSEREFTFPSIVPEMPAANWYEREIKDMFGLVPVGHPDLRPLVVHEDWPEKYYPLRQDFPVSKQPPRVTGEYPFQMVDGEGIYEIPVGPVHAGIIEPGHFRFSALGETIVNLEIRHFWTHKGSEKLFEQRTLAKGVALAERISGDATIAHSLAYCQAVERLARVAISRRAALLRTIFAELERLYFHIGDIGGITLDVGFAFGAAQASRLKEQILRLNERMTGNRLLRAVNVVGGITIDLDDTKLREIDLVVEKIATEVRELSEIITNTPSVIDRLETTGVLTTQVAQDLGVVGVIARASGIDEDCRRDHPYAGYPDIDFTVPIYRYGDVMARLRVRVDEVAQSCHIIAQAIEKLPDEPLRVEIPSVPAGRAALGYAESGRGRVIFWVLSADKNMVGRCKIISPSFINWPAIQHAVLGNIVPDFPLINKSFNLSYSGCDR